MSQHAAGGAATSSIAPPAHVSEAARPGLRRRVATAALLCGMFASAIELTVVGTAMPRIAGALGGSDRFAWVLSIYLLTTTIAAPTSGKLADLLGRKPVFLGSMALFLLGSALCGAAPSMTFLVVARAIQGLGGGALSTASLTLIGDLYNPVERGRVQGLFSGVWGLAGALGPFVGGLLVDGVGWRWVFYLNLPFGLASMALLAWALRERVTRRAVQLDLAGTAVLTVAVLALQSAGASEHGPASTSGRASTRSFAAFAVAVVAFALFALIERRAKAPLLPVALAKNRVVGAALLTTLGCGAAMFALTSYVPLFVQGVLGASARDAGAAIAPMSIGWPAAGVLAGLLLTKIDARRLVRLGVALVAVGAALTLFAGAPGALGATLDPRTVLLASSGLLGVGMGLSQTVLVVALQTAVPWEQRGIATAAFSFCRTMGGALGVVLAGALQSARLASTGVSPARIDAALRPGARVTDEALRAALSLGVRGAFIALAAMGLTAWLASLFFPRVSIDREGRHTHAPE